MQITLYNTCPIEYEKKLKKIQRLVLDPAYRDGKDVEIKELKEQITHKRHCSHINDKRNYNFSLRKKIACKTCPFYSSDSPGNFGRDHSDTTMKIKIS